MPDQDTITEYLTLLQAHRRTLQQLLHQEALSTEAYVLPAVASGIADARAEIERLKTALRGWGVVVDDEPADTGLPAVPARRALILPPALWMAIGVALAVLVIGGLALRSPGSPAAQPTAAPTATLSPTHAPAPTLVPSPTAQPTLVPTPTAEPIPVFITRYPLNVEALELAEFVVQPGVVSARPITDSLRVTLLELGTFEGSNQPAWNVRLVFTNTRDAPVVLDLDRRFFTLADEQGRAADLVYFCCPAKGDLLGAGQSRELQLFFRSPDGWFGKGTSARQITLRAEGLLPIARAAWSFPALATAN